MVQIISLFKDKLITILDTYSLKTPNSVTYETQSLSCIDKSLKDKYDCF